MLPLERTECTTQIATRSDFAQPMECEEREPTWPPHPEACVLQHPLPHWCGLVPSHGPELGFPGTVAEGGYFSLSPPVNTCPQPPPPAHVGISGFWPSVGPLGPRNLVTWCSPSCPEPAQGEAEAQPARACPLGAQRPPGPAVTRNAPQRALFLSPETHTCRVEACSISLSLNTS